MFVCSRRLRACDLGKLHSVALVTFPFPALQDVFSQPLGSTANTKVDELEIATSPWICPTWHLSRLWPLSFHAPRLEVGVRGPSIAARIIITALDTQASPPLRPARLIISFSPACLVSSRFQALNLRRLRLRAMDLPVKIWPIS